MLNNKKRIDQLINLKGRAAIVTGAERGIGRAIALRLAEAGADLCISGLNQIELDKLKQEIEGCYSCHVITCPIDLEEKKAGYHLIQTASQSFTHLDILVNNAGIFPLTPCLDIDDNEWQRVLTVNLHAAFTVSRELAKLIKQRSGTGVILNILSISALCSAGNSTHYVASKHALAGVTKSMATELGPLGIRCLALAPGMILTPGLEQLASSSQQGQQDLDEYAKSIPLQRAGEADEVACAALFAVSDLASFITGAIIPVDGGDLAK